MEGESPRRVLARARKGLRPGPGSRTRGWAALRARLEDPADIPELPRIPPMDRTLAPRYVWIAAAVAVAAAVLLWLGLRPRAMTAVRETTPAQAPDGRAGTPPTDRAREGDGRKEHTNASPAPAHPPEPADERAVTAERRAAPAPRQPPRKPAVAPRPEPTPTPSDTRPEPAPPIAPDTLHAEMILARAARAALRRGDAATALAKATEHDRKFPRGELAPQREAIRIEALCVLGRTNDAQRRAEAFAAAHPSSSVARALRAQPCAKKR